MKQLILIVLFGVSISVANVNLFLGMPNTKNVFMGAEMTNGYGLYLKHSMLINDPDMLINSKQQYVQIGLFYRWFAWKWLDGFYRIYGGARYDGMFWNAGSQMFARLGMPKHFNIEFALQPFYDSELKDFWGYMVRVRTSTLKHISAFGGFKNIPEYRVVERRLNVGLSFYEENLRVDCEISSPTSWKTQFTRVSVGFVYGIEL